MVAGIATVTQGDHGCSYRSPARAETSVFRPKPQNKQKIGGLSMTCLGRPFLGTKNVYAFLKSLCNCLQKKASGENPLIMRMGAETPNLKKFK
jgi:hypothetical protein